MKEYTVVGNFDHKGKKYEFLIDEDRKYFFLGINENGEY